MTYLHKCTYIYNSWGKGAPTFKAEKISGGAFPNTKWDLHYVEYTKAAGTVAN